MLLKSPTHAVRRRNRALLVGWSVTVGCLVMTAVHTDIYVWTEWFINYAAGFTRRGLAGAALIRMLHDPQDLRQFAVMLKLVFVAYAWAFAWILARVTSALPTRWLLALLMLPAGLVNAAADLDFVFRKDLLAMWLVMGVLTWRAVHPGGVRTGVRLVVFAGMGALCAMVLLIHEAAFFWAVVPLVHMLRAPRAGRGGDNRVLLACVVAFGLFTVALTLRVLPSAALDDMWRAIPPGIRDSWGLGDHNVSGGAPDFLGMGAVAHIRFTLVSKWGAQLFVWGILGGYSLAMVLSVGYEVLLALKRAERVPEWMWWCCLHGLAMSPLFLVGKDWGRWIFLIANGWLVMLLYTLLQQHEASGSPALSAQARRIAGAMAVGAREISPRVSLVHTVLWLYLTLVFHLPHADFLPRNAWGGSAIAMVRGVRMLVHSGGPSDPP